MNPEPFSSTIVKKFFSLGWTAIDWLFPPQCAGCGAPGKTWCEDCQAKIQRTQINVCPVCGTPRKNGQLCADCRKEMPDFAWVRSWANYDAMMKDIIHQLKYFNNIALAIPLGEKLVECYQHSPFHADLVTAVPMSHQRRRKRGYNQAMLIARAFCHKTNLPLKASALKRIRQTETQVGKHPRERMLNVQNAFAANLEEVVGKTVLVIDDVFTTGATLRVCASALKKAGAVCVIGLTAARAGLHQEDAQPPAELWAL